MIEDVNPYPTPSYNPFGANFVPGGSSNALLTLGLELTTSPPTVKPLLVKSVKLGTHSITFTLPLNARWQNGKAITSKDVVMSLLLYGEELNGEWASISKVGTPNSKTVTVDLQPWAVPENLLLELASTLVVPSSEYGRFVPPGTERNIFAYWKLNDVLHPSAAATKGAEDSAAGKALGADTKQLEDFSPTKLVGDGPYELESASTSGVVYEKWRGFAEANRIRVPKVEILPMESGEALGATLSHRLDWETTNQYTDPQVTRIDSTPDLHYVMVQEPMVNDALIFNEHVYPFNLLKVRQAIAYLIDRKTLAQLQMGGTLLQNPPVKRPTDMPAPMDTYYLSKSQYQSLQSYSHSPAKASALLKSAGFSKRGGLWYTPKGKQYQFTIDEIAGKNWSEADGPHEADVLTNFGIKVSASYENAATYVSQLDAGDYPVAEYWANWANPTPISHYYELFVGLASAMNLRTVQNVPGLGKVDIQQTLNAELNEARPSQWRRLAWDWARFVNENLPVVPLYTNSLHETYSTQNFVDWPKTSNRLWTGGGLIEFELAGYIKPR